MERTSGNNRRFDDEGERSVSDIPSAGLQPPTGNINNGPGAGAINQGEKAGSIIDHQNEINFKLSKDDFEANVPSGRNINKGPGAAAVNSGKWSASIIHCKGPINF